MAHRNSYNLKFNRDNPYIVFDNLKHFLNCELFRRLESPILSAPGQWLPLLSKRLELQQRVINAVK